MTMSKYLPLRIVGLFLGLWVPSSMGLLSEEQERLLPEVPWRDTKDLAVEEIGTPLGIPVVKLLPLMERPPMGLSSNHSGIGQMAGRSTSSH